MTPHGNTLDSRFGAVFGDGRTANIRYESEMELELVKALLDIRSVVNSRGAVLCCDDGVSISDGVLMIDGEAVASCVMGVSYVSRWVNLPFEAEASPLHAGLRSVLIEQVQRREQAHVDEVPYGQISGRARQLLKAQA